MMHCLITFLVLSVPIGAQILENVFFKKLSEFSMSNSRWIMTFVISIEPYNDFLDKLSKDIDKAAAPTDTIMTAYGHDYNLKPDRDGVDLKLYGDMSNNVSQIYKNQYDEFNQYYQVFRSLKHEVTLTRELHNSLVSRFDEYKTLRHLSHQGRQRRALFGFLAPLFTDGIGLLSQANLDSVKRNVKKLFENQKTVQHTLEESITVLNTSSFAINENRQSINEIVTALETLSKEFVTTRGVTNRQISNVEKFVYLYSKVTLVLDEIKSMLQNCIFFYLQLEIKLNALTVGHLTANIIPASQLQQALVDISAKLPKTLTLPADPLTNLFEYYKHLTCQTFLDGEQIIVVTEIKLVEHSRLFELYEARSLQLPYGDISPTNDKGLVAFYDLESKYLAINRERTLYMLLSQTEAGICMDPLLKSFSLKRAINSVHQSPTRITNLFVQNAKKSKQYCQLFATNTGLPQAIFIDDSTYFIMINSPMAFYINCRNDESNRQVINIEAPYGMIKINTSCTATSEQLTLVGSYESESNYSVQSTMTFLKYLDFTNIELKLNQLTNFSELDLKIPKSLKALEKVPVTSLLQELDTLQTMEEMPLDDSFPVWGYSGILLGIIAFIILAKCLIKKYVIKRIITGFGKRSYNLNKITQQQQERDQLEILYEPTYERTSIQPAATSTKDGTRVREVDTGMVSSLFEGVSSKQLKAEAFKPVLNGLDMQLA